MGLFGTGRQAAKPEPDDFLKDLRHDHDAKTRAARAPARFEACAQRDEVYRQGEAKIAAARAAAAKAPELRAQADALVRQAFALEQGVETAKMEARGGVERFDRELRLDPPPAVVEFKADLDALLRAQESRAFTVGREPEVDAFPEERRAAWEDAKARLFAIRAARNECPALEVLSDVAAAQRIAQLRIELGPDLDRFLAQATGRAS